MSEEDGGGNDRDDDVFSHDETNLSQRGRLTATIDQIPMDDDSDDDRQRLNARPRLGGGATTMALGNADAIRPEEQVINNTAYYNLVSLWSAMYIREKEGFALPIVFDAATQQMVQNKRVRYNFDQ